ncbi:MobF family relaxase [Sphingomonas cynarae]|uniref:MobF family relaxase n=1 Tax=Sphingomonas cynarae TaxID=930197 RepID=A0ABP7ERJ7_9SPHN
MTVRPAKLAGGGDPASYYAADNYYTGEQEGLSVWGGEGAAALGLSGHVEAGVFTAVLEGRLPGDVTIAAGGNGRRSKGFELTFNAPKSVSLVALIGSDARVVAAHARAVSATMAWAEARFGQARVGKAGAVIEPGGLVYAGFQHDLSRKLDPHLHTHVVIANAAQRRDGTWVALHNPALWKQSSLIGAAYHAELRAELGKLGYGTEINGKHGQFDIVGIPRGVIEAFSARREEILRKADELGLSSPRAMEAIAVRSRDAKQAGDAEAARALWAEKALVHGERVRAVVDAARDMGLPRSVRGTVREWGTALIERVTQAFGPRSEPLLRGLDDVRRGGDLASAYAVAAGVRHLGERTASFRHDDLMTASLGMAEKGATVRTIEARIDALQAAGILIAGPRGGMHADRLTTRDILATEKAILKAVRDGVGSATPILDGAAAKDALTRAAEARGVTLADEQRHAGLAMLAGDNSIQLVQGDAGSGKSFLFEIVAAVCAEAGVGMLVLVPQNKLMEEMGGRGFEMRSLASVLQAHGDRGDRVRGNEALSALVQGKLVVLEEASMVSSRQFAALTRIMAVGGAAKLVPVGDMKQISAPGAGRPFALLQGAGMPTARLSENRRQQTDTLREAAMLARQGRVGDAFALLGDRVRENTDPAAAAVAHYLAVAPDERDRIALLTSGHALREAVLGAVRDGLLEEGALGPDAVTLKVWDNLNLTREELRQTRHWAPGMQLDIYRHQAGLVPGSYAVAGVDAVRGTVELARDGATRVFTPGWLHHAGQGAALSVPDTIEVREGDRLIFTGGDTSRGIVNGTAVTVERIEGDSLHLSGRARDHVIGPDDPMRERLGHGAVLNMHRAQGITVDRAITVMDSHDRLLNSQSLYYVLQTRAREDMVLHTDDRAALVEAIETHRGDVPHALDLAPERTPPSGERLDAVTDELPRPEQAVDRDAALLDVMSAALTAIGENLRQPQLEQPDALAAVASDQRTAPARPTHHERLELARKDLEPEISYDYDMDM